MKHTEKLLTVLFLTIGWFCWLWLTLSGHFIAVPFFILMTVVFVITPTYLINEWLFE